MKRLLAAVCFAALPVSGLIAPPASAQLFGGIVYDPTNHAENVLQAVRALQQIEQQAQQLLHEIEMLETMARNLESLPGDVAGAIILDRINRLQALLAEAEGIGYAVPGLETIYDEAYPDAYGDATPNAVLVEEARARWRQSRTAWRDSLVTLSAALENNEADADAIADLVARSQAAVGALQAAQAGNQLAALQAEQLMQLEVMMAAQFRAEALERARALAEQSRAQARMQSFFGD